MVKELERSGLPTAHVCNMTAVVLQVGSNRIVPSTSVLHPLGDPKLSPQGENDLRQAIVLTALRALETPVEGQKIFDRT
ncbi:MAG: glycine/betaine/sarcosine/D-proline family reductase selenoprotein B [Chloroflexi bacterium]|nr:glycine/betaine/sarcosine/D-proline family reductase selenoprotein B [Chloroflexota bacterium]